MARRTQAANTTALLYVWLQITIFGALISETILLYPNVFRDVPQSIDTTHEFLQVTDPGSFFPPVGTFAIAVGLVCLGLLWKWRPARYWVTASLAVFILGNFVFSVLFAWPRNVILFEEGIDTHSAAYLQQVAREFLVGHWVRMLSSAAAGALAFAGFLGFYRQKLTAAPASA